ncbi:hypothetical protein M406DRAFT_325548 [Cryphonectria parasitica EP155]|uniref:NACHT-NTPase and P-loop NTPases N-terminal domain-containing protein n=1 Tax=Cryphonectria parasitica (strain ATCC 38755 / EP155) TaxID=660469 RepID=A0A9P4YAR0_CRYP1|nr:uncharacterized protein M406DRAFT_325548 [Cryphonectria parasitica EP155]KAF3770077.1 hypothetical protein M406DRAFT_325548 [Cryphonectria parasitica EP155]
MWLLFSVFFLTAALAFRMCSDAIGSAAAIAQLLGEAIKLWQMISRARQAVRTAPEVRANTAGLLSSLLDTMHLVEREPNLQNPGVDQALQHIYAVAGELNHILEGMVARQRRSTLRQSLHALCRREAEEAHLRDVLGRLYGARGDLLLRINVLQVGLMGEVVEGMQKSELEVPTARQGPIRSADEDIHHRLVLEDNETWEQADQVNGIIALEGSATSTTAELKGNRALGNSRQKNFILGGTVPLSILVHMAG